MSSKKQVVRSNAAQIKFLVEYMAAHTNFAAREFKGPLGGAQYNQQWARLKAALDELGPIRTVDQWKLCWRDQKKKARAEGAAVARGRLRTGDNTFVPEISDTTEVVLGIIGSAMATGLGPAETPIGQPLLDDPQPSSSRVEPIAVPERSRRGQRRPRKEMPSTRFLDAQRETNLLLKELIEEIRISNGHRKRANELRELMLPRRRSI